MKMHSGALLFWHAPSAAGTAAAAARVLVLLRGGESASATTYNGNAEGERTWLRSSIEERERAVVRERGQI